MQLGVDIPDVRVDGVLAQEEMLGDAFLRQAIDEQVEHLAFAEAPVRRHGLTSCRGAGSKKAPGNHDAGHAIPQGVKP